jgi:hypothetical protein
VYDQYQYAEENQRVLETVAAHFVGLIEGPRAGNVVDITAAKRA